MRKLRVVTPDFQPAAAEILSLDWFFDSPKGQPISLFFSLFIGLLTVWAVGEGRIGFEGFIVGASLAGLIALLEAIRKSRAIAKQKLLQEFKND